MNNRRRTVIGVLIVLFALAIVAHGPIRDAVYSGAATSVTLTTTATVTSIGPTINSTETTTSIDLAAGPGTTMAWCNVTVHDDNGNSDIHNVNATLYYNGSTLSGSQDTNQRYVNYTCHPGSAADNGSGVWRAYNCSFTLNYCAHVAKSTDGAGWVCTVFANDTGGMVNSSNITNIAVNTLVAINTNQSTVAYGSVAPGGTSGGVEILVTNWGNVVMDLAHAGTNMTNQSAIAGGQAGFLPNPDGQINVSQQNYSTDIAFAHASAMKIPNVSLANATYNLPNATACVGGAASQAAQNRSAWYRLNVIPGQAPSTYQGYIILTASDGT